MHVFPFHALNKNPDKVIKARLITESFQIMHIFLPRPGKNGLSEQVERSAKVNTIPSYW